MSRSMIIVMWTSWLWHHWTDAWDAWERGFSVTVGVLFQLFGGDWRSGPSSSPLIFVSARRNFRAFKSTRRNWATLPQIVWRWSRRVLELRRELSWKTGKILPWTRPSHCRIPGRVGIFLVVLCQNDPTKPNAPCSCSKFLGFLGRKLLATERERPAHIAAADAQPVNQIASKLVNS